MFKKNLWISIILICCFFGQVFAGANMTWGGYLKQSTAATVLVGPFMDDDGTETIVTVTPDAMSCTFVYADGTGTEDQDLDDGNILTMSNVSAGAEGWGTITITSANTAQVGPLLMTVWSDTADVCFPITYRFTVVPAKAYEMHTSGSIDVDTVLGQSPFNNTTDYVIPVPFVAGTVATYTSTTSITLDTAAAATANLYKGHMIEFPTGTGMNQSAIITAYTSGRVATLAPALNVALSTDTTYRIYPGTLNVGTVVLETPFDNSTDTVQLANDTITSAKFDESTAYPLKSADTGSTAVARTGADSDTLKTLSDQMDATDTAAEIAAAVGIYSEASNSVNATGTTKSHIVLDSALAVLTDPIYCRVLYYDADTGLYSGHLCINYNSTAQSIDIFPALKITPATADTVTIIGEYSGLLPSDITKYAPR